MKKSSENHENGELPNFVPSSIQLAELSNLLNEDVIHKFEPLNLGLRMMNMLKCKINAIFSVKISSKSIRTDETIIS